MWRKLFWTTLGYLIGGLIYETYLSLTPGGYGEMIFATASFAMGGAMMIANMDSK